MTTVVKLVRRRQAGGAAAYDSDLFAASKGGDAGFHPAVGIGSFNNIEFVVVHGHRLSVHPVDAGLFTEGGADAPGKLRKIAGLEQAGKGVSLVSCVDLVVPLRDQVVQGTAGHHSFETDGALAHGHTAVHAPRALLPARLRIQRQMEFFVVIDPVPGIPVGIFLSCIFQKTCRFSHNNSLQSYPTQTE